MPHYRPPIPVPGVEDWHAIPGTEGCYEFSLYLDGDARPLGWVRSWLFGRGHPDRIRLHPQLLRAQHARGYRWFWRNNRHPQGRLYSHRASLEIYAGPCPAGMVTRHLDGDKLNNHPDNLRWGTQLENEADKLVHGTIPRAEAHGHAKLRNSDIEPILLALCAGESQSGVARRFGVDQCTINTIASGRVWRSVTSVEPCATLMSRLRPRRRSGRTA